MSTTVTPAPQEDFFAKYKKARNEGAKPAAAPAGATTPEAKTPATQVTPGAGGPPAQAKPEDTGTPLTRAQRRAQNHLHQELGAERAKREMLERQLADLQKAGGITPALAAAKPPADPEPQRAAYTSDVEYTKALSGWTARQETAKALDAHNKQTQDRADQDSQLKDLQELAAASDAKFKEDVQLFTDWDAVSKAAQEDADAPKWSWQEHTGLYALFFTSKHRAAIAYYMAKNPEETQALLDLTAEPTKQIEAFREMEGLARGLYTHGKKAPAKVAAKTAAELDALKPPPTSAVTPRGGHAATTDIPMTLPNGSLNPAWKANRNAARGLRP